MTPLRQRFVEDLQVRNYAASTIESYTYHVACFAKFHGRSPELLGPEEVRAYQVQLVTVKKVSWSTFNQTVCALRFLYRITLPRDWPETMIPFGKKPKTLPRPTYRSVPAWAAKTWPACSHVYRRRTTA